MICKRNYILCLFFIVGPLCGSLLLAEAAESRSFKCYYLIRLPILLRVYVYPAGVLYIMQRLVKDVLCQGEAPMQVHEGNELKRIAVWLKL